MAKLFSKEMHEHSNTWYFKSSVFSFEREALSVKKYYDKDGHIVFVFASSDQRRKVLPSTVTIVYDKKEETIVKHVCSSCQTEACPHFLNVINWAYTYLSTDIAEKVNVQAFLGNYLSANEYYQQTMLHSRIMLAYVFDPSSDRIRFYFENYGQFNIKLIAQYLSGKPFKEEDEEQKKFILRQISAFSEIELELFKKLYFYKCAVSAQNNFFTVYKKDFPEFIYLLVNLNKVFFKETGDPLIFKNESLPITFQISPQREKKLSVPHSQMISAAYTGKTTWIFKKNELYKVDLPFLPAISQQIFKEGLPVKNEELVYFKAVVARQLSLINCYLDFPEDEPLPPFIDSVPKVRIELEKAGEDIILSGNLDYEGKYSIPISVILYTSELVRVRLEEEEIWFYVPPGIRYQVYDFAEKLPHASSHRLETDSQLVFSGEQTLDLLKQAIFEYTPAEWEINLSEELKQEFIYKVELAPVIKVAQPESGDINWFSYEIKYQYHDVTFTHEELKRFFHSKNKYLKLQDGRLLFFSNKKAFEDLEHFLKKREKALDFSAKLAIYNLPYLSQLTGGSGRLELDNSEYLKEMAISVAARKNKEESLPPGNLQFIMRSYQKAGFNWLKMLQKYYLGGILADDMGLGKTLQTLALISSLPSTAVTLVICPKTLLYNWAAEIEKFCPSLSFIIYEGSKEERGELIKNLRVNILLASYSIIQNDLMDLEKIDFEYIIIDEAQHIKNAKALRTKAIKQLKAHHKLALTGTPVENHPGEIWSIYDFLMPNYLPSLAYFKKQFGLDDNEDEKTRLVKMVSPFLLRRKKHQVLIELPAKQEQVIYSKLSAVQEKMYLQILEQIKKEFTFEQEPNYLHVLAALTRLRQVCNHPCLADAALKEQPEMSGKIDLLSEIIQEAIENGKKLLIFSQFIGMLKLLSKMLAKEGISFEYLDGSVKDRRKRVDNFNNNAAVRAFLISMKTGGAGLNLTAADTVILVDPWWNPQGENQAIDRAHRIGQTQKVMVYKVITKGTVEEKMIALQQKKKALFDYLVEDGQTVLKTMSLEDLKSLFEY